MTAQRNRSPLVSELPAIDVALYAKEPDKVRVVIDWEDWIIEEHGK